MQAELFENKAAKKGDEHLYNQLIKLGDMMGDGLHHEPDGKWIEREYKQVSMMLFPEEFAAQRKAKRKSVDEKVAALIQVEKCTCGGDLRQIRKGAKTLKCCQCSLKYRVKTVKKGNV